MLESKAEFKKLDSKDIKWIIKYAHGYTTKKHLQEAFKYHTISFATRVNHTVTSIVVMIVGKDKHYVALLWTNGSYRAVRESMLYFRELSKKSTVLFHSRNDIVKNHRITVNSEKSGRVYYKMVV